MTNENVGDYASPSAVKMPRLNANEDELELAAILVEEGERVDSGDDLFIVETIKATVSIEAETSGYVRRLYWDEGEMVPVEGVLTVLTNSPDDPLPEKYASRSSVRDTEETFRNRSGKEEGLTAKERLESRRRRPRPMGRDRTRQPSPAVEGPEVVPSDELTWVSGARARFRTIQARENRKTWDAASLERCSGREQPGIVVGSNVSVGANVSIRAEKVVIEDDVDLGDGIHLDVEKVFIGEGTRVGDRTSAVTQELILGRSVVVASEVLVDVSGGMTDESRLCVGPASLIAARTVVNTAREVVLETESALSPGAMVFTHSYWQSVLDGYPAQYGPVRLCEEAWVGAGCQLLPGVSIGAGAVVMSNSTVVSDVSPTSLVGGVPAEVLREDARRPRSEAERHDLLGELIEDLVSHLDSRGCEIELLADSPFQARVDPPQGTERLLRYEGGPTKGAVGPQAKEGAILITAGGGEDTSRAGVVFDVGAGVFRGEMDPLVHEIRNFFRRYGIRFRPPGWNSNPLRGI